MSLSDQIIQHRRNLHRIPEVGLDLPLTMDYLLEALEGGGERVGKGIVVDLGTEGPLFAWRADCDALPIQEETEADFSSNIPGQMHACGHDAHMAIALGLVSYYMKNPLPCRLRVIFQPGEEGHGGARHMIEAGCLEGVGAIAGLHVGSSFPEIPLGQFGSRMNSVMAAASIFKVKFRGEGGHGGRPPSAHKNALLVASDFVNRIANARDSQSGGYHPSIISIGSIHAGEAPNVIPDTSVVTGTIRASRMEKLKDHHLALEYLANTYGKDNGVEVSVEIENKTPVTFNTGGMFVNLERAMEDLDYPFTRVEFPTLGSEDFGEYQKHVPGVFFFLKTTPVGGAPQHNSHFEIQEPLLYRAIPLIDRLMYRWAEQMEVV